MAPPGVDACAQRVRAFSAVLPRAAKLASAPQMQVLTGAPAQSTISRETQQ